MINLDANPRNADWMKRDLPFRTPAELRAFLRRNRMSPAKFLTLPIAQRNQKQVAALLSRKAEMHLSKAGGPGSGLVPHKTMVFPKHGKPYSTTRWIKPQDSDSPIHIVPAASYLGDLHEVFQAWQTFISQMGQEVTHRLLVPIVALQQILFLGHGGVLAIQDNRVIGVATVQEGQDLIAASPLDDLQGRGALIKATLLEGLQAYEMV